MKSKIAIKIIVLISLLIANRGYCTPITIKGVLDDSKATKLSINSFSYLYQEWNVVTVDVIDREFEFQLDLQQPSILNVYSNYFYVTPGDHIELTIVGTHLTDAKGVNSGNYMFLSTIPQSLKPNWRLTPYTNPFQFKNDLKSYYENIIASLEDFKKNNSVSEDFETYVKLDFEYQYYNELLFYFRSNKNEYELTNDFIEEIYEADINIGLFMSDNYMKFLQSLLAYQSGGEINAKREVDDYRNLFQLISEKFEGQEKEALFYFNFQSAEFNLSESFAGLWDSLYNEYIHNFPEGSFKNEVNRVYEDYKIYKNSIPDFVLEDLVVGLNGEEISLGELLKHSMGKVVYLDIWASWCGPCLAEIPAANSLSNKYKGRDIDFIYLSIDEEKENWENIIKNKELEQRENNYWLPKGKDSEIVRYLKFTGIPRYIFLNKNGRIVKTDATRPSNRNTVYTIEELLNE